MAGNLGMVDPEAEARRRERQREYLYFLDDAGEKGIYAAKLRAMMDGKETRLIVNMNHLREAYPERAAGLLSASFEELQAFQAALKEIVATMDPEFAASKEEFYVGFEGSFGHRHVNPRSLKAKFLGNLVCCEGIVTKCSLVRPKVVRSVHYCPATNKTLERRFTDLTSYDAFPSSNHYPTEDENKNPLETEFGLSTFKDHQTFSIQELPEKAPAGQLPRSLDIVADNDLADGCMPGDRIRVIGVYRCLPSKQDGFTNGTFRTILIANNIMLMSKNTEDEATTEDMALIKKFRTMKNIDHFDVMAKSLAPSICGQEEVKAAILALLLGGTEKILPNGTRLRGDINVLLIGDPSVAKSQCLRYVLHSAPRAVATTGRGSSGVGLTAAVTTDSETGERRLEAGAMVLADRGVVCIDEFDKMSDMDRTAIHEVMEQGRVTIAKAGIQAKLNARCSVLAAANPVFGKYDIYKSPMENIGMQDSLLSRFDLCFVLLDEHEAERDARIAAHVVKLHSYRAPDEEEGAVLPFGDNAEALTTLDLSAASGPTALYEKNTAWTAAGKSQKILTLPFMRKYINLAKQTRPQLSPEARDVIEQKYCDLRDFDEKKSDRERTTPVTARTLETLIRLATAHAKARMSPTITRLDAQKASELLHYACFKEKPKERLEEEARGKRRRADAEGGDENEEPMEEEDDEIVLKRSSKRREPVDVPDGPADDPAAKRPRTETPAISLDRYTEFKRHLRSVFDSNPSNNESLPLADVVDGIQQLADSTFSSGEVSAAVERMSDDNLSMICDGNLVLI